MLEAVIILPCVLVCVFALVFAALWLGEAAVIEGAVRRGAVYAARLISDPQYETVTAYAASGGADQPDFGAGTYVFNKKASIKPYRYLLPADGDISDKVEAYVTSIIENTKIGVTGAELEEVTCTQKNMILYQQVTIKAETSYSLPGVFEAVGLGALLKLEAEAVSAVTDPDEFIRNVDFAAEIIFDIVEKTGIKDKIEEYAESISGVFDKILGFKDKLFG